MVAKDLFVGHRDRGTLWLHVFG